MTASRKDASSKRKKGLIYLYTGEGEGKSTNAFGMALRAVGHGLPVVIVQFMKGKGNDIGEYKIQEKLKPLYQVHQFGREDFIDFDNPSKEDYELAKKGLKFAQKALKSRPRLLILDEINLAVHFNIIPLEEVLSLLEDIPLATTVILTGRRAPDALIEIADLVTDVRLVKHPYDVGLNGREGIEF